jgi:hypothetical protein
MLRESLGRRSPTVNTPAVDGYPHTVLVARCKNGNSDETRSSPCDRVGSENADLIAARTEGSNVIDGSL